MEYEFDGEQDLVVIGGGPGGYEAALAGAQLGANVTLIESDGVGGSAVLTDVVPSKSLIATADAAGAVDEAKRMGLEFVVDGVLVDPEVRVDLAGVNERILMLAKQQSVDMRDALDAAGVTLVRGRGRLVGHHEVVAEVVDERGRPQERSFHAHITVIATGAHPRQLAGAMPDGERILTWKQLYGLEVLPEHLIIIGSGVTGAEFASAYSLLGSKVTLISSRERVLPGEDEDAANLIEDVFLRGGMTVLSQSRALSVRRDGDTVIATLVDGRTVVGSHCLMAVGSIPNTVGLGLEENGVQVSASGHIKVNRVARTTIPEIYAVGDCSEFMPLASVATMQGRTAVFHAFGDEVLPTKIRNIAANIFTSPEIASIGYSQAQIEAGVTQGVVYKIPLSSNPRAKMQGIEDGFVKIFAREGSGTVIGGVVVAPHASELIFPITLAVEHRLTVDEVARSFTVYPSLSGAIQDAARAMHLVKR